MPLNADRRNSLYQMLPEGIVTSRKWLIEKKITIHAIDNLVKSGQIQVIAPGIYMRPTRTLTWQGLVCSLQTMFGLDVVAGGLTALEMQGYGHYMPMSTQKIVYLYSSQKLPQWVYKVIKDIEFIHHSNSELLGRGEKKSDSEFSLDMFITIHTWREGRHHPMVISAPERAILEVLTGVPEYVSFEHASQLMQGMTSLSPQKLQILLENCHNVKVRRLFFWLADRQNYPWLQKLDRDRISLGSGNRVLLKGGKLNKKYKITVPEIYE